MQYVCMYVYLYAICGLWSCSYVLYLQGIGQNRGRKCQSKWSCNYTGFPCDMKYERIQLVTLQHMSPCPLLPQVLRLDGCEWLCTVMQTTPFHW